MSGTLNSDLMSIQAQKKTLYGKLRTEHLRLNQAPLGLTDLGFDAGSVVASHMDTDSVLSASQGNKNLIERQIFEKSLERRTFQKHFDERDVALERVGVMSSMRRSYLHSDPKIQGKYEGKLEQEIDAVARQVAQEQCGERKMISYELGETFRNFGLGEVRPLWNARRVHLSLSKLSEISQVDLRQRIPFSVVLTGITFASVGMTAALLAPFAGVAVLTSFFPPFLITFAPLWLPGAASLATQAYSFARFRNHPEIKYNFSRKPSPFIEHVQRSRSGTKVPHLYVKSVKCVGDAELIRLEVTSSSVADIPFSLRSADTLRPSQTAIKKSTAFRSLRAL